MSLSNKEFRLITYFRSESRLADIVIIGAGFAGLSAGALLSKDHDVLVLERNSYVGGRAATKTAKEWNWADTNDYKVDFGHHVFASNSYIEYVAKMTGATDYFYMKLIDMPYFYRYNAFHKPPVGFFEQLKAYPFIPITSKLKLNKFLKFVSKVSYKEVMEKWAYRSLRELYDEFGFDDYGRELFTDGFAAGYQTLTDVNRNSAGDLILCMKTFQKGVKAYKTPLFGAEGGVGEIARAFRRVIDNNNGEVRLSTNVKEIVIKDGKVVGVKIDDELIETKRVLFTAPAYFLLNLIDEDEFPSDYKERLEEGKEEATDLFLIIGGAKKPLRKKPIGTWVLVPKSEVSHVNSYYLIYEVGEQMKQAPEGRYVVSFAVMPSKADMDDPEKLKNRMIKDMEEIFPDFDFDNDFEWSKTVYFPIVDGIGRTVDWYHKKRFGPETPFEGLYLAGDSAYELSTGVDGVVSSALFAVEKITGQKLIDLEEFYKV